MKSVSRVISWKMYGGNQDVFAAAAFIFGSLVIMILSFDQGFG